MRTALPDESLKISPFLKILVRLLTSMAQMKESTEDLSGVLAVGNVGSGLHAERDSTRSAAEMNRDWKGEWMCTSVNYYFSAKNPNAESVNSFFKFTTVSNPST